MRIHKSVLLKESIENLLFKNTGIFVDCTLGSGGHSLSILNQLQKGTLVCIDSDEQAVKDFAEVLLSNGYNQESTRFTKGDLTVYVIQNNFSNIKEVLKDLGISKVDGIFADLGWSSDQLTGIEGLSYENQEANLDMRLSNSLAVKASDLLNVLGAKNLSKMFLDYADIYGQDNKFLVERIVDERKTKPFQKVKDLLPILDKTARMQNPKSFYAKVFQALRIAVNNEYKNLEDLLNGSLEVLNHNGRVLIITFHSGESNIVSKFIKSNNLEPIFKKNGESFLVPSVQELTENLSARSAKLFGYTQNEQ